MLSTGRSLLTDTEDRTLAMAEDEYVSFKIARSVLGTYYGRDVSFREISSIVGRLSRLRLLRWRIRRNGSFYFRLDAPQSAQRNGSAWFTTNTVGKAHLAEQSRRVR